MCFSAEASFVASGALVMGSVAVSRLPRQKKTTALALVPVAFSVHQLIEGLIWLNQDGIFPKSFTPFLTNAYVFIAYILWPVFIPITVIFLEQQNWRRGVILVCQMLGIVVGLYFLAEMVQYPPVVSTSCGHLYYNMAVSNWVGPLYLVAVSVPFLASSSKGLVLFGLGILLSCLLADLLVSFAVFPSIWCFFAAILSVGLYLHFRFEARDNMFIPRENVTLTG